MSAGAGPAVDTDVAASSPHPRPGPDLSAGAYRWAVGALTTLVLAISCGWALTTPAFHGPDEVQHVNSVVRILDGGGWPDPYEVSVQGSTWRAVAESGSPLVAEYYGPDAGVAPAGPGERSDLRPTDDLDDRWRDQMVQHPPGYYLVTAGVVEAAGGTALSWDTALLLMRLVSAFSVAAAVPFLVGIGTRVTGSRRAGVVGGAAVLAIPFFTTMAGYVTNDTLLVPLVSAALYATLRALDDRRPWLWLALGGLALGLALLVKGLALMAIPAVGLLSLLVAFRRVHGWWPRLLALALPQAVAFVVGGWWWLRNLVRLGTLQPSQMSDRVPVDGVQTDTAFFLGAFVRRFFRLFWGRGANEQLAYPDVVVAVATVVLLVVVLAALVVSRRRLVLLALLVVPVLITLVTMRNAYAIYVDLGQANRGVQGRYVFAGIGAVTSSVAAVWWALAGRRRLAGPLAVAGVAASGLVVAGGWLWVFVRLWSPLRDGWGAARSAAADALGAPATVQPALLAVAAASALVLALALLRSPHPHPHDDDGDEADQAAYVGGRDPAGAPRA